MKYNRFYSILALLLIAGNAVASPLPLEGSGEASDPFGLVDNAKYPNTMTITGYVRLGDEVLDSTAVVAIYQGDELRGKKSPADNGKYQSILMLTIYGETKGQPLHFKVFTGGRVIEVDQGLTFSSDVRVGKAKEPYYIDLPVPIVTTPVTEGWATTCLPYNAEVPEGVTVWIVTGIDEDGVLIKEQLDGNILPANTPVLLQGGDLESYEWLSRVADGDINTEGSILKGTTEDTTITEGTPLVLGESEDGAAGFWPVDDGTVVPAYSAYITDYPDDIPGATFEEYVPTALHALDYSTISQSDNCYDLQGRRINSKMVKSSNSQIFKRGHGGQLIRLLP